MAHLSLRCAGLAALAATAAAAAAGAAPPHASSCVGRWVATTGSDDGPGSLAQPYATVARAVADLRAGLASTVYLRAGLFFLNATLDLSGLSASSSTGCPTIAAYDLPQPSILSGALPLDAAAFAPVGPELVVRGAFPGALVANLTAALPAGLVDLSSSLRCSASLNGHGASSTRPAGLEVYDLATDSVLPYASFPPPQPIAAPYDTIFASAGWANHGAGVVGLGPNLTARLPAWLPQLQSPRPDTFVHGHWGYNWADATYPAVDWDLSNATNATFSFGPCDIPDICDGCCSPWSSSRFALLNLLAEARAPGQVYYNSSSTELVLVPPSPTWQPAVSRLEYLVNATNASGILLQGLQLRHARHIAVVFDNCTGCAFAGGSVAFTGGQCVNITGGSGSGVLDSEVHGCGAGGVFLHGGNRSDLTPSGHYVSRSSVHDYNRFVWNYAPGVYQIGVGTVINESEIYSGPHNAVLVSGNAHTLSGSHIHDVVLHAGDSGAYYFGRDWSFRGNVIVNTTFSNCVSDIGNDNGGWFSASAVYTDDGASGLAVEGCRFVNVTRAIRAYGGRSHRIINNTVAGVVYDFLQADNLPPGCNATHPPSAQVANLLQTPFNTSSQWLAAYGGWPDFLPAILSDDACNNHHMIVLNNSGCALGGAAMVPHSPAQIEAWGGQWAGNNFTGGACA